jgi:mRNA interferase YafQ
MRAIKYTARFRRDYRREKSGILARKLDKLPMEAVNILAADRPLPERLRDHALAGECKDHRDCHIRPDLALIYRKPDDDSLELVRLGSHSELIPKASRSDSWGDSLGAKFLTLWELEDSRHASSGEIARRLFG